MENLLLRKKCFQNDYSQCTWTEVKSVGSRGRVDDHLMCGPDEAWEATETQVAVVEPGSGPKTSLLLQQVQGILRGHGKLVQATDAWLTSSPLVTPEPDLLAGTLQRNDQNSTADT